VAPRIKKRQRLEDEQGTWPIRGGRPVEWGVKGAAGSTIATLTTAVAALEPPLIINELPA
jgi:hypothetical protein